MADTSTFHTNQNPIKVQKMNAGVFAQFRHEWILEYKTPPSLTSSSSSSHHSLSFSRLCASFSSPFMADMYGTPPSLVSPIASDSEDFSNIFTHLLHSSPSSCVVSKPKTLPSTWPAGFFRSGSDHLLKTGNPVGSSDLLADCSSAFNFSDPYAYAPADVKETTGNELFLTGVDDSDENTSFKEQMISPESDPADFICPVEVFCTRLSFNYVWLPDLLIFLLVGDETKMRDGIWNTSNFLMIFWRQYFWDFH